MNNAGPFLTLRLFDWWSREGLNLYDISISTNALSQLSYSPQFDLIIKSVGMNKIFSKKQGPFLTHGVFKHGKAMELKTRITLKLMIPTIFRCSRNAHICSVKSLHCRVSPFSATFITISVRKWLRSFCISWRFCN
jgi:hypothetical protein